MRAIDIGLIFVSIGLASMAVAARRLYRVHQVGNFYLPDSRIEARLFRGWGDPSSFGVNLATVLLALLLGGLAIMIRGFLLVGYWDLRNLGLEVFATSAN